MFEVFLEDRDWLLADGGMGTGLHATGLKRGESPELWNETHAREVRALHQQFVDAGADIILTNSFGANAPRLAQYDAEDRVHAINVLAARHARAVTDRLERQVLVAGAVGPTGERAGALTEAEATSLFAAQMSALIVGGAEMIWIETMSALPELRAAVTAVTKLKLPYAVTTTAETPEAAVELARLCAEAGSAPEALGSNCIGPEATLACVRALATAMPDARIIAKPGLGTESSEQMGAWAKQALDAGARVIGGCCGTTAGHLAAMRSALLT